MKLSRYYKKDFTFHKTTIKDLISSPRTKETKHNKEDDVIKSWEEALIYIRQNSAERNNFKSQRSFSSIDPYSNKENENIQKKLFTEHSHHSSKSNKDFSKSGFDVGQKVLKQVHDTVSNQLNDSFGTSVDHTIQNINNKNIKYSVEFAQHNRSDEDSDYDEEDPDDQVQIKINPHDSQGVSIHNDSDEDEAIENAIKDFSNLNNSNIITHYGMNGISKESEYSNDNIFKCSHDTSQSLK